MGTFGELEAKVHAIQQELDGTAKARRLKVVGERLKPHVDRAVHGTLGDLSMSGWRRGNPINIVGASYIKSDHELVVAPNKAGRGPMRVLEQGRNTGNASGFAGPGVNRSTGQTARTKSGGVRKVRSVKSRRWNGVTKGKGTWRHAVDAIQKNTGSTVREVMVSDVLASHFGKG